MKKKEVKKGADEIMKIQLVNFPEYTIRKESGPSERASGRYVKYYEVGDGREDEIATYEEGLTDALLNSLLPLKLFTETLDNQDDPPPLYYLLEELIDLMESRLQDIGHAVEKEVDIDLHRVLHSFRGLNTGTVLGPTMKGERP